MVVGEWGSGEGRRPRCSKVTGVYGHRSLRFWVKTLKEIKTEKGKSYTYIG